MSIAVPVTGTQISVATFGKPMVDAVNAHQASFDVLSGAWATWSPTHTNFTVGAGGLITARYLLYGVGGKTCSYYWQFVYGSGSAVGTAPSFTLPVAPASYYGTGRTTAFPGTVHLLDSGTAHRQGNLSISSGSTVSITYWNATPNLGDITISIPWTWTTSDAMTIWGTYETA